MDYIERWGCGIQKICDAWRALGTDLPGYEVLGNGIHLCFKALKSALIDKSDAPTDNDSASERTMVLRLIEILREEPDISQKPLGERLGTTRRIVQKYTNMLKDSGCIVRIGGKRYGRRQINE